MHVEAEMVSRKVTMFNTIESRRGQSNPATRGYHAVYRDNEVNHCPGCGRTHWYLGRVLAECAFCSTALPLQESFRHGPAPAPEIRRSRPSYAALNAA
jgi:hypothetical protein